jgi:hypothetical protein
MTVNIKSTALSISQSLDSLETTPLAMHRITFFVESIDSWYSIMREARSLYSNNWKCQRRIKRKLNQMFLPKPLEVWFEVPDLAFGTWVAVKHGVKVKSISLLR